MIPRHITTSPIDNIYLVLLANFETGKFKLLLILFRRNVSRLTREIQSWRMSALSKMNQQQPNHNTRHGILQYPGSSQADPH